MIACLAKNSRGEPLFQALAEIDERYKYLGQPKPQRAVLMRGFLSSVQADHLGMKRDARFSPIYLSQMSKECAAKIDAASEKLEAVVYWGATNLPLDPDRHKAPFFIVTDGPFDPDDPAYPPEWRPARWAGTYFETQRRIFSLATHVFTLSEWARDKVIRVHGLDESRVSKCGWGPIGNYGPPRLDPVGGKVIFLSVGSEWRRKAMDIVAEAGAKIHAENAEVETLIAGEPVDLELLSKPGISLLPYRVPAVAVHALMRQASCLVHAARFDASPHVLYEALQYGTPVIATRTCGVPEAITPESGLLIEHSDAPELAQAMRTFLTMDQAKLRAGAFQAYTRAGGWPAVAARIHKVIASHLPQK